MKKVQVCLDLILIYGILIVLRSFISMNIYSRKSKEFVFEGHLFLWINIFEKFLIIWINGFMIYINYSLNIMVNKNIYIYEWYILKSNTIFFITGCPNWIGVQLATKPNWFKPTFFCQLGNVFLTRCRTSGKLSQNCTIR